MTECPVTTIDLSGKFCNSDSDCPIQQVNYQLIVISSCILP